jgi:hypothetical protein
MHKDAMLLKRARHIQNQNNQTTANLWLPLNNGERQRQRWGKNEDSYGYVTFAEELS